MWAAGMLAVACAGLMGCSTPKSATSGPAGTSTAGVEIKYVDHHWVDAVNFKRISEYFTGVENKSGRVIERTDPKERAGYYFIVDLAWHPGVVLPAGTVAELDYVRNDNAIAKHAKFVFSEDTGTLPEFCLGLTGADWKNKDETIIAYKLTLEDTAGKVLATRQSFLWALPDNVSGATAAVKP